MKSNNPYKRISELEKAVSVDVGRLRVYFLLAVLVMTLINTFFYFI